MGRVVRRAVVVLLAAAALVSGPPIPASASPGALDATFTTSTLDRGDDRSGVSILAMTPQSDGKVIALLERGVVARMGSDGTLDTSFGNGRGFTRAVSGSTVVPTASTSDVLLSVGTTDGITVGGQVEGTGVWVLARLTGDGALVSSFGSGGVISIDLTGVGDDVIALATLDDGTTILGVHTSGGPRLVRVWASGALDLTLAQPAGLSASGSVQLAPAASGGFYDAYSHNGTSRIERRVGNGALDHSFADHGVLTIPGGCSLVGTSGALTVSCQPNVHRFHEDGAVDGSFGGDGSAAWPPNGHDVIGVDGAGRVYFFDIENGTLGLRRLTAGGATDGSYGNAGRAMAPGLSTGPHGVGADGRFVYTVWSPDRYGGDAAALGPSGLADATFGGDGTAAFPLRVDLLDRVRWVLPAAGGGAYVVRSVRWWEQEDGFGLGITRLDASGRVVSSFGTGGRLEVPQGISALVDGANRVVVVSSPVSDTKTTFRRFTASGRPDTTYGTNGEVTLDFHFESFVPAPAMAADGSLLLVTWPPWGGQLQLFRLTPGGSLDTGFGGDGIADPPLVKGPSVAQQVTSLAADQSGRFVLGYTYGTPSSDHGAALARLLPSGALDPRFGTGGVVDLPARPYTSLAGRPGTPDTTRPDQVVAGPGGTLVTLVAHESATGPLVPELGVVRVDADGRTLAEAAIRGFPTDRIGERPESLVVEPDGRVTIGVPGPESLVRLDPFLRRDSSFHPDPEAQARLRSADGAALAEIGGRLVLASGVRSRSVAEPADVVDAQVMALDGGPPTTRFVPVAPARLLDTRAGFGAPRARVGAGQTIALQVSGRSGVPAGAVAVALTVTAVDAAPGFVTVWPSGEPRPTASNLNTTRPGQTTAAQVIVPLGAGGRVDLFTQGGGDFVADLAGWYEPADSANAGRFRPVVPARLVDTRGQSRPGAGATVVVPVAGRAGVPASGANAVVVTLTSVDSTPGHLTAWPSGTPRPTASNLNPGFPGQTIAGHAIVPLGADGALAIYTSGGGHVVIDVAGWFTDASAPTATSGLFVPLAPSRRLDTRVPVGVSSAGRRSAGSTTLLPLGGGGGIPPSGVGAVVANVTAADADPLHVTVWAADAARPLASNLNVSSKGEIVANLVTAPSTATGSVRLFTSGATHLLADTAGWYTL